MESFKEKLNLSKKTAANKMKKYFKALLFGCKIEVTGMLDST